MITQIAIFLGLTLGSCFIRQTSETEKTVSLNSEIKTGASQTELYFPLLQGKKVALVANQTSLVKGVHLADTMLKAGIHLTKVFAPEHGFRGESGAGETIKDGKDSRTGLPVLSLYGKNKKPSKEQLSGVDIIVFDIQDVGARFYTYISTMHYVMEAAAEEHIPVIVLDRPNPNGFYIDGPVLDTTLRSFVGMDPIPIVHGCTVGELAKMINGESWLKSGVKCDLQVIACSNYTHQSEYHLAVRPSPNLSTVTSISLYPSLCLFEGTIVSVGRGTAHPFEWIGYPEYPGGDVRFTPADITHVVSDPPYEGKECKGLNLEQFGEAYFRQHPRIELSWLMDMYSKCPDKAHFFNNPAFFDKLAGTKTLRESIQAGKSEAEIRKEWERNLNAYREIRKKYLLYPD